MIELDEGFIEEIYEIVGVCDELLHKDLKVIDEKPKG